MNKRINTLRDEAIKDIEEVKEFFPNMEKDTIKFWLKSMYQQGYIDGLNWAIEKRKNG